MAAPKVQIAPPGSNNQAPTSDLSQVDAAQIQAMASGSKSKDAEFANKVISWTKSMHVRCRNLRQQIERQWYLNMAYYIGKQNVQLLPVNQGNASGTRLYTPPVPYYRSRPVYNRIRPAVRTELSKLTSQKPTATIVPSTGEDQDLAAAQAGEQLWESIYREKKIKAVFRQACFWSLIAGVGYIKSYWNPGATDEDGTKGDFCFESITPFHIFVPEMLTEDIEDQPFVIHIQTRSVDWVNMKYPGINAQPNVIEADDILSDSFLSLVGAHDTRKQSCMIYEVWVKPGNVPFLPNGGMFTIVADKLVQFVEGNPYEHGQYPFTKFPHLPTGRYYADSTINDLISPQREYNRTRGQITEAKNRMAHPQIMAAQGSIEAQKITTEPGQVIYYKLGYPVPQPLPMQNMPPYVLQEIDRLLMDFEDISGQHQVSKGQAPAGVTAATAISYLQEQDDSMLATTYAAIEDGFEKIGYQTLCYVQQYWNTPRMVKVVGRDGQFNVMAFQGSDLRENTDIRIEAGSALPTSKAAKQAFLMDLMQLGYIPPDKGLELMDIGGVQRLYEEIQIDSAQASRENMRMSAVTDDMMSEYLQTFMPQQDPMQQLMQQASQSPLTDFGGGQPDQMGQPGMQQPDQMQQDPISALLGGMGGDQQPQQPQQLIDPNTGGPLVDQSGNPTAPPLIVPVNSFDNHQVHIQTHNNYRKSQQYEQLPPQVKALFEEHVNQHMQMLGMIPGVPAPQQGANAVSSGGMQAGQITPEMLQQVPQGNPQGGSAAPGATPNQGGASPNGTPPANVGAPPAGGNAPGGIPNG